MGVIVSNPLGSILCTGDAPQGVLFVQLVWGLACCGLRSLEVSLVKDPPDGAWRYRSFSSRRDRLSDLLAILSSDILVSLDCLLGGAQFLRSSLQRPAKYWSIYYPLRPNDEGFGIWIYIALEIVLHDKLADTCRESS